MVQSKSLKEIQDNPSNPDIASRSVCLNFKIGSLRGRKHVPSSMIQVVQADVPGTDLLKQPDKELLHVSKSVLICPTLKEIGSMDGEMYDYIKARCLPSMMRKGIYILAVGLLEEVDVKIAEYERNRLKLVDYFIDNQYEQIIEKDRIRLGPLFDDKDYPPKSEIKRKFYVEYSIFSFGVPNTLKALKSDLWKREFIKSQEFWKQSGQMFSALLRDEFKKLVVHLAESLEIGDDGKKKRFYESTVTKLTDWLDLIKKRNLADDVDIEALAADAKKLLEGVAVVDIKDDEKLRKSIKKDFAEIAKKAEKLAADRPLRAIDLGDDD